MDRQTFEMIRDNRYLQIELKETEKINALRYLPRSSDTNGIVTEYSIKVSTDGKNWTEVAKSDADSTWSKSVEWKLAQVCTGRCKIYPSLWCVNRRTVCSRSK